MMLLSSLFVVQQRIVVVGSAWLRGGGKVAGLGIGRTRWLSLSIGTKDYDSKSRSSSSGGELCGGCGVRLQSNDNSLPGFVQKSVLDRYFSQKNESKDSICQEKLGAKEVREAVPLDFINDDGSAIALHGYELPDYTNAEMAMKVHTINAPICQRCHHIRYHHEDLFPQPISTMVNELSTLRDLSASTPRLGICC
eukprot:m.46499 g.46499  ORF g.46499 m.46499 type:complete len:195 (+) comp7271_c0_seq1:74-658(+)